MIKRPENAKELHQWCRNVVEDGRDMRRAHEAVWWQSIAAFSGDLWAEFNPHDRKLYEVPKSEIRTRLAINLIQPVVRTEYAKLLKNKPLINSVAESTDPRAMNAAKVGDVVLNNYCEKTYHKPRVRRGALIWVLLCGMGGIFTDYDESAYAEITVPAGRDGTPIFDPVVLKELQAYYKDVAHRPMPTTTIRVGDLRYAVVSPFSLVWDFSKLDPHDSAWCVYSEVFDTLEIERRWNVQVEAKGGVKPAVMEQRLLNRIDLTGQASFDSLTSQDLAEVHRMFIKPGHLFFPEGAEIVYTDEALVDVTNFPYTHKQLPISMMGHVPMPTSRHPMSVIPQIADVALELSKTESQMVDNRNIMSNPPWLEWDLNDIPEGAIQNKPGLRIKAKFRPGVPEPHPVQMPDLPGYMKDLPVIFREHILEISGQGETSQGKVPAGARSGVAIAYLQEEDDTKLGPTVQEFEEMIERESWQTLQLIAQFFEIPRTIQVYKRNSEPEVIDFYGSMLQGIAGVEVQAGSALPRSKAAKQQFMFDLWDRGVVQDPRQLMEMLELTQAEAADWEVDIEQAERENAKMQAGQQQNVLQWYTHEIHQYVHRRHMKSAEYDDYPDDVKKIYEDHDSMHTKAIEAKQLEAAAMALVTGAQNGAEANGNGQLASANGMNQPVPQQGGPPQPTAPPGNLTSDQPE
jgi:hypothetical protein